MQMSHCHVTRNFFFLGADAGAHWMIQRTNEHLSELIAVRACIVQRARALFHFTQDFNAPK